MLEAEKNMEKYSDSSFCCHGDRELERPRCSCLDRTTKWPSKNARVEQLCMCKHNCSSNIQWKTTAYSVWWIKPQMETVLCEFRSVTLSGVMLLLILTCSGFIPTSVAQGNIYFLCSVLCCKCIIILDPFIKLSGWPRG